MARGRRVNSSGEKSKQLLLEKAVELFSTHGYHQTKISDIVKAANLTQPTFYLYFQSKESLFKDLNMEFQKNLYEILNTGVAQATEDVRDVRSKVFENLKQIFYYFVENPHLTKIGFYTSEEARQVKDDLVCRLVDIIESEKGQICISSEVETSTLAESLVGSIERLTLTTLLTNASKPEKVASDIVNIYFIEQPKLIEQGSK